MIPTILGPLPAPLVTAIGTTSLVLTVVCVVPLVVATWQGRAHPSAVMWGLFTAVGVVATIGMARGGAPTFAWAEKGALSLGPAAVCAVALWRGDRQRMTRVDHVCLAVGAIGTVVYAFTDEGMVAVLVAMAVDAIAAGPTWVRAWHHPYDELRITYVLAALSVLAVLAILPTPWTLLGVLYLWFLVAQMVSFVVALTAGRRRAAVAPLTVVTP